jgi:class 3 adenylate cyclase
MEFREGTQRVGLALMFTDIVGSTGLVAELGDDAWSTVLSWHDDVLREQFHAHGGREVRQLGDGFFTVFQDPYPAVACAVKIQRRLAHQSGGVGLSVRIAVHRSEVVQRGSDYLGRGVHEAARMAAIARGGEIVVSVPTLTAATVPFPPSASQRVTLRGLPEPVDIVRIAASRSRRRCRPGDLPRRDPLHAVSPVRPAAHVATA